MFGHVKGAFTDARADRKGRFEMADGGTIFLDEIGEVDPAAQVKLLRVLQDRSYEVLGSSVTRTVDVRVVSATNRDLGEMVARGQFREDLLYRLNLIAMRLPAAARAPGGHPAARPALPRSLARAPTGARPIALTDRALDWLQDQPWPGNIRQLKQTIERAVLVVDGDRLDVGDLVALSGLEEREARGAGAAEPGHHDARRDGKGDDRQMHAPLRGQRHPRRRGAGAVAGRALPAVREVWARSAL